MIDYIIYNKPIEVSLQTKQESMEWERDFEQCPIGLKKIWCGIDCRIRLDDGSPRRPPVTRSAVIGQCYLVDDGFIGARIEPKKFWQTCSPKS